MGVPYILVFPVRRLFAHEKYDFPVTPSWTKMVVGHPGVPSGFVQWRNFYTGLDTEAWALNSNAGGVTMGQVISVHQAVHRDRGSVDPARLRCNLWLEPPSAGPSMTKSECEFRQALFKSWIDEIDDSEVLEVPNRQTEDGVVLMREDLDPFDSRAGLP